MVAGKSFFFSKIGVQSCVRFRCTLLHSYFALHNLVIYIKLYDQFNLEYGYAFPTISQLQVSCGIRSKATIHNSLKNLVKVGLIAKEKTRWGNNTYFVYKPMSKDELYDCYPNEVKSFIEFEMKEANIAALDKERFNTKPLRKA